MSGRALRAAEAAQAAETATAAGAGDAGGCAQQPPNTWVLLRGLTRGVDHWGDFGQRLEARVPGSRVVAIDLPGNGRLHRQRSPLNVADMLADCRAQLLGRAVPPPYCLFAMSLGAMVALEWARRQPVELQRAVLVNTSVAGLHPWHWRLRPASAAMLAGLLIGGADGDAWEAAILRLTTRHPPAPAELLRRWQDQRRACPVRHANALRQLWAAARFRIATRPTGVPLLLLASPCDRLVDVRCSRRLASRWALPIAEHPSAGHDLPTDAPDWVVAQVAHGSNGV